MRKTTYILLVLFVIFGYSCQNYTELDLPEAELKITVDGWIENNDYPYVILTLSSNYFSVIDSAVLRELVLTRARVEVSSDNESEVLTLVKNEDYFPPYLYRGFDIKGENGKTYELRVDYGGKTITSFTTIPAPILLDSIWFEANNPDDTLGIIKVAFTDNPEEKNYYKTFAKILGENTRYIPTLISNFDDKYFNGESFIFSLNRGQDTYLRPMSNIYFNNTDTINVKICTLDKTSFQFWISYQDEIINAGNPFASSHKKVLSNIDGGLGIWCGYGSTRYVLVVR